MREAVTAVPAVVGKVGWCPGGGVGCSFAVNRGGGVLGGKYHGWVGRVLVSGGISCASVELVEMPAVGPKAGEGAEKSATGLAVLLGVSLLPIESRLEVELPWLESWLLAQ